MDDLKQEAQEINSAIIPSANAVRSIEETVQQAERYVNAMVKIRGLAIKATNYLDWSNQGGNPYLEKSGCDKIASTFGIQFESPTFEKETMTDDRGEYVQYTCSGDGRWNNIQCSEIGTCSSRDDFFGTHKVDGEKALKPLSEVDLTDVKKKAFTNWSNRLIKKLLGLSFTWEEIKTLSDGKITQENVSKVDFAKGSKGGNADSPETKKKREECRQWILKLNDGEVESAKKMLVSMTEFKGRDGNMVAGKDNVVKLSEKQVDILHEKLKKGMAELEKQAAAEAKHA
jgi:hypothetical protein